MKKLVKACVLVALLVMSGQAMAQFQKQYNGSVFVSAAFPLKDYGKFESLSQYALTMPEETYAGAEMGFNVGLKWYFNVGVKGLGVMLSADGFYNGPNGDVKDAFRAKENNPESYFGEDMHGDSYVYLYKPMYFNVPIMLGLNYTYELGSHFAVYIEAGAGGNCRFITDMGVVAKGHNSTDNVVERIIYGYDHAFSFTYQAGFGFEVAKNLVIGCSFYDLGAASVKCEKTIKTYINDDAPVTEPKYLELGTIHPVMVLGRIGLKF